MHTSRYMGGITRQRDLRVITKSIGAHKVDQHFSLDMDDDILLAPERVAGPSRGADFPQALPESKPGHGFTHSAEERMALLREVSAAPPEVPLLGSTLLARSAPQLPPAQQARSFHTSSRVPYDSTSYNVTDVPDFFVKYKQHRTTGIHELAHEESGLMPSLASSILLGDIVANTRRLKTKIPVEHHTAEGHVVHPSGFVVPGPGHFSTSDVARAKEGKRNEVEDRLAQTAAIADRVLESDDEKVDATTLPSLHKVPFEVREQDGTVKHASGFVPPTPSHKFRYTVDCDALWERKVSVTRLKIRRPSPSRAVLRAVHTTSRPNTSGNV